MLWFSGYFGLKLRRNLHDAEVLASFRELGGFAMPMVGVTHPTTTSMRRLLQAERAGAWSVSV